MSCSECSLRTQDACTCWVCEFGQFQLDGSASAVAWLHKNIVSMKTLWLKISLDMPRRLLQDIMEGGM